MACRSDAAPTLYAEYAKPLLASLQKLLRIDRVYVRAEGDFLVDDAGGQVLDLLGGYGSTLLGHNHPKLIASLIEAYTNRLPTHVQGSIRAPAARLAQRINEHIARALPGSSRYLVHLSSTGTEAVEAAIKHALLEYGERRKRWLAVMDKMLVDLEEHTPADSRRAPLAALRRSISETAPVLLALRRGYHGKTLGSLAATWNPAFKTMLDQQPLRVEFLDADDVLASEDTVRRLAQPAVVPGLPRMSSFIGILFEPLQSEGGMFVLPAAFAEWMVRVREEFGMPLIADEIQSGCYRTGRFLCSQHIGLVPDYVLLGKSLGGGLGKISATCIAQSRYVADFSWIHSSTFAEDEPSSLMALEFFDVIEQLDPPIDQRAATFESRMRDEVARIQKEIGPFIREVRGCGFLLGLDFDMAGDEVDIPVFLKTATDAGVGSYLFMSYLLSAHAIRVGVTLSKATVLRIEPSAFLLPEHIDRLAVALRSLCELIRDRKLARLTSHLWDVAPAQVDIQSPVRVRVAVRGRTISRIAFITHVIDNENVGRMDPALGQLDNDERGRFIDRFGDFADPVMYHEQVIRSRDGAEVLLEIYGIMRTTAFFERCLRTRDFAALEEVRSALGRAAGNGNVLAGLGQYTSIVSSNGMLVRDLGLGITTGNSLTAAFAFRTLENSLCAQGRDLRASRVGIVGAGGNICNVITQLIGDHAQSVVLVHRDDPDSLRRMAPAVERIMENSGLRRDQITLTHDRRCLQDCDAIVLGTNTTERLITPDVLKNDAVLVDISVPSNVDPSVFAERPDVRAFHGALATLPDGQVLTTDWMPLPPGQVYACLAETITLGLSSQLTHYSVGGLKKSQVIDILKLADAAGIGVGMPVPLRTR